MERRDLSIAAHRGRSRASTRRARAAAAALVAVSAAIAPAPALAQALPRIILPLFIQDSTVLTAIDQVAVGSPPQQTTVVLDFGIGCFASPNTANLVAAVDRAHQRGLKVFGYIPSCGAGNEASCHPPCDAGVNHDTTSMSRYITTWFGFPTTSGPIDGIFLDMGPNAASAHAYYQTIYGFVKQNADRRISAATVMLNNPATGGFQNDSGIFAVTDILQTYEDSLANLTTWPPANPLSFFNPPWDPSRVYMLVSNVLSTQVSTTASAMKSHGIVNYYLFDGNAGGPYNHVPPYWSTEAAAAYGFPTNVSLTGSGTGTVTSSPAGLTCRSGTCTAWLGASQPVTLNAAVGPNTRFDGFQGACTSATTPCTYTPSSLSQTVTATFTARSFTVSATPASTTKPSTGSSTIALTSVNGFAGNVSLSATGLPAGAGPAAFSPNPTALNGSASATLSLPSGTAAAGSYTITVTAQSSGLTRTTTFTWTIADPTPTPSGAPAISGVGASTTPTAATVTWTTDLSSDSSVDYGPTSAYGTTATGNTGTSHSVSLAGLTPGTTYHYRVRSRTAPGNPEAASGDLLLPLVTGVSAAAGSTSATITWTTNFTSSHAVDYGTTTSYGSTQTSTAPNATSHSVTLSGLLPSTTYQFRVRSAGGLDGTTSGNFTFVTSSSTAVPVSSLVDGFDALDTTRWTSSTSVAGDGVQGKAGLLTLTPAASTASAGVFVSSTSAYSLLNSSATVNALEVVSASGSVNCKFNFHAPGAAAFSEVVGFWYEGGTLYAYWYSGGVQHSAGSAAYSRDAHAWWRLRHAGTTVFWETSRDRSTWSVLGQVPQSSLTFDLSNGSVGFDVKAFGTGNPSPGRASFTHLNLAPTPIQQLADPFTAVDPARWWVSLNSAASSATIGSGLLSLSPEPGNGNGGAFVVGMRPFALTGSQITVKVPQAISSGGNVNQIFRVAPGPFAWDDGLGFWLESGTLYAFQEALGSPTAVATLPWSPTTHAWWRIRESGGTVFWDTSADGVTWTQRGSAPVSGLSFSPAIVTLFITSREFGAGTPSPGTARFSSLNGP